jgi:hypothetical protein
MYDLLGDPACELKLSQEMSLTVSPVGNNLFFVLGETTTDCSELICDFFRVRKERTLPGAGLSKRERRDYFEEMGCRPFLKKFSFSNHQSDNQVRYIQMKFYSLYSFRLLIKYIIHTIATKLSPT